MKKLKGIFKPLRCYFKCSFKEWDYYPVLWCSKPSLIQIISHDVMWKDKYNTPRYEDVPPYIWIHIYKLNFILYWSLPPHQYKELNNYWEQALWYLYYYEDYKMKIPDIIEAEKYWPWEDYHTKLSTWNNKFLIK